LLQTLPFDGDLVRYRLGAVGARHDPSHYASLHHVTDDYSGAYQDLIRTVVRRGPPEARGLDTGIAEALRSGDQKRAKDYEENGPKLSIFGERDHGALLQIVGGRRNALQYDIGNPLTASKMTRYQLPAALYAPLRVVLFENEQGRGVFEYDKPSSFFGQYGDERVTQVGRYLDATLEAVLRNAAE
jgi:uncharacterized protein (DUF302 family)